MFLAQTLEYLSKKIDIKIASAKCMTSTCLINEEQTIGKMYVIIIEHEKCPY